MSRLPIGRTSLFLLLALDVCGCKQTDRTTQSTASAAVAIPASATAVSDAVAALTATAGQLVGIVKIDGHLPAPQRIDVSSCPDCQTLHPDGLVDETVVAAPDGALQNVIVYLEGESSRANTGAALPPAHLDQSGCRYEPHVIALQTGQPLNVTSSDPFVHNVHGMAIDNPAFNFSDRQMTLRFGKPEIFPVRCDVHPWMKAWIAVFPTAAFAVTKPDGSFVINNVAPGHYTLQAWHERLGRLSRSVEVMKDQPARISLTYAR